MRRWIGMLIALALATWLGFFLLGRGAKERRQAVLDTRSPVAPAHDRLVQATGVHVAAAAPPVAATDPSVGDASEWQGMKIEPSETASCDVSARCGLAMACRDGRCDACRQDTDCAAGEVCALDHCVLAPLASCRSRRDCASDALCVLSGHSPDLRGNAQMTARCLADRGGRVQGGVEDPIRPADDLPAPPHPIRADDLLETL